MAMVANNPMITTTMSSSIRVKPFETSLPTLRAPKGNRARKSLARCHI